MDPGLVSPETAPVYTNRLNNLQLGSFGKCVYLLCVSHIIPCKWGCDNNLGGGRARADRRNVLRTPFVINGKNEMDSQDFLFLFNFLHYFKINLTFINLFFICLGAINLFCIIPQRIL